MLGSADVVWRGVEVAVGVLVPVDTIIDCGSEAL